MDKEVEKDYDEFWKEIVENKDGSVNIQQVKKELYDYHQLIRSVQKVYCYITNDRISKPNTDSEVVILEAQDVMKKLILNEIGCLKEDIIRVIEFYE